MTVTTTYYFSYETIFDPMSPAGGTGNADVTALTDGTYVLGTDVGSDWTAFRYAADGTDLGQSGSLTGDTGAVSGQLDGTFAQASLYLSGNLLLVGFREPDGTLISSVGLGLSSAANVDIAALTNGSVAAVYDFPDGGQRHIAFTIATPFGTTIPFVITSALTGDFSNPVVAALDNGNYAIAFQRDFLGQSTIWTAVYDPLGAQITAPVTVDGFGTVNRKPAIVATAGGYAIVYEDNGWNDLPEITLARMNSTGGLIGYTNVGIVGVDDANPAIARLSNGFLAISMDDETNGPADTDVLVRLYDPTTDSIVANQTMLSSIVDDVSGSAISGGLFGRLMVAQNNATDATVEGAILQPVRESTSDAASDEIDGDEFMDIMEGGAGDDTLNGMANRDSLFGDEGNDVLAGGDGDDYLEGGADDDVLDGGLGRDTVSYEGATSGVLVELHSINPQNTGGGGIDTLTGFEAVIGSNYADTLIRGFSEPIRMSGLDGDDFFGVILSSPGVGNDTIDGGSGNDTMSYVGADTSVQINLSTGTSTIGLGDENVLISIESAFGSEFDDTIVGGGSAPGGSFLFGGSGNDLITAGSGTGGIETIDGSSGNDTLIDGSEQDLFFGGAGNDIIRLTTPGNATNGQVYDGGSDFDTIELMGGGLYDARFVSAPAGIRRIERIDFNVGAVASKEFRTQAIYVDGNIGSVDAGLVHNLDVRFHAGANSTLTFVTTDPGLDDQFVDLSSLTFSNWTSGDLIRVLGSSSNQEFYGSSISDSLDGGAGNDTLTSGGGADTIIGGAGADSVVGGAGADLLVFKKGEIVTGEVIHGFTGLAGDVDVDTLLKSGSGGVDFRGAAANITGIEKIAFDVQGGTAYFSSFQFATGKIATTSNVEGNTGNDFLSVNRVSAGTINLSGLTFTNWNTSGTDLVQLFGSSSNDALVGTSQKDALIGVGGRDTLTGGLGDDRFEFRSLTDLGSTAATTDVITDFTRVAGNRDFLRLADIDANGVLPGDQAFTWIGTNAFSGTAGELRYVVTGATTVRLEGDVFGDSTADIMLNIAGVGTFQSNWIVL